MHPVHALLARPNTIQHSRKSRFAGALRALLLTVCLWLTASNAWAQQQELLQLAVAAGRMSQLSAMQGPEALGELRAQRDSLAKQVEALSKSAIPANAGARYADQLKRVQQSWKKSAEVADGLIERQPTLATASADAELVYAMAPAILGRVDELLRQLAKDGASGELVYIAGRQVAFLERVQRRVHDVLQGGLTAITAADGLRRDFAMLSRTQKALSAGDAEIGIAMLEDEASRALSAEIDSALDALKAPVERLVNAANELTQAQEQSEELRWELDEFQRRVIELHASIQLPPH